MGSSVECHPDLARHIGVRIHTARAERKLSRPGLARLIDAHPKTVFRWERGEHQITATRLTMLAAALDKPIDYFTEGFPKKRILPSKDQE